MNRCTGNLRGGYRESRRDSENGEWAGRIISTDPWNDHANHGDARPYRSQVLELSGKVVGFASSNPFRDKAGYASSVETTIVLAGEAIGQGWGGPLLGSLLDLLARTAVHRTYASIALPNPPSIELHAKYGYQEVGTLDEVGFKKGEYHSVLIMERAF